MHTLHGHIAVVTGAGSGVGQAIALALAAQGATLCLVGRTPATLEATASDATHAKVTARCYPTDLTHDDAVRALAVQLHREWDAIDIMVHSAGVSTVGKLETAPVTDLDRQYRTNVRAPYLLTQMLLPLLRRRQGQVVFINSLVVLTAGGQAGAYARPKNGLTGLSNSFREEGKPEGVPGVRVLLGRNTRPQASILPRPK